MLHLSLLRLPRRAARWRYLEPYQLHQVLWRAFPELPRHTGEGRFLYRHEEDEDRHCVLVQSATAPDWSFLDNEAEGTTSCMRSFDPSKIERESVYRFRLRANPAVRRRGYTDNTTGARHIPVGSDRHRQAEMLGVALDAVPTREEQLQSWLARKGSEGGFTLLDCVPGPNHDVLIGQPIRDTSTHERSPERKPRPILLTAVEFDGLLRVSDAAAFERTLRQGIGRGKGFGFGLLSIARAA
jgi:CRISPR system Cascade subunit CasE